MLKQTPTVSKCPTRTTLEKVFRRGDVVMQVFKQKTNAKGASEGLEVLNGSEGVL